MKNRILLISLLVLFSLTFLPTQVPAINIQDMESDHWAYSSVRYLVEIGLLNLYDDNTFRGQNLITRYQMAVLLERMLGYVEVDTPVTTEEDMLFLRRLSTEFQEDLVKLNEQARLLKLELDEMEDWRVILSDELNLVIRDINNLEKEIEATVKAMQGDVRVFQENLLQTEISFNQKVEELYDSIARSEKQIKDMERLLTENLEKRLLSFEERMETIEGEPHHETLALAQQAAQDVKRLMESLSLIRRDLEQLKDFSHNRVEYLESLIKTEKQDTQVQIVELQTQISTLHSFYLELEKRKNELFDFNKDILSYFYELRLKSDDLFIFTEELEERCNQLSILYRELEDQNRVLFSYYDDLFQSYEDLERKYNELHLYTRNNNRELLALKENYNRLQGEKETLFNKTEDLYEQNKRLFLMAEDLYGEINLLKREKDSLTQEKDKLIGESDKLFQETEDLFERTSILEKDRDTLKDKTDLLHFLLKEEQDRIEKTKNEVAAIKTQILLLTEEKETLEERASRLEGDLQAESKKLQEEIQTIKGDISRLLRETDSLQQQHNSLQDHFHEATTLLLEEISLLQSETHRLDREADELREFTMELERETSQLRATTETLDSLIKAEEERIDELKKETKKDLDLLKGEHLKLVSLEEALRKRVDLLEDHKTQLTNENIELRDRMGLLEETVDAYEDKYQFTKDEIEKMRKDNTRFRMFMGAGMLVLFVSLYLTIP